MLHNKRFFLGLGIVFLFSMTMGFFTLDARADEKLGVGFEVGSPTAITAKLWKAEDRAIDAGIGYWFGDYYDIYGDYLFHFPSALSKSQAPLPEITPYVGIGADLQIFGKANPQNSAGLYIRIPLGLEWMPKSTPIGVFLEIVPNVRVIPNMAGYLGGGLGVRYYF